jgi:hypothetical protein
VLAVIGAGVTAAHYPLAVRGPERGLWFDFEEAQGGDLFALGPVPILPLAAVTARLIHAPQESGDHGGAVLAE